ncbi:superoxide dismutase family protein [Blastopirellula sp. J2-11]|uniref:superoxide dismutase family protein n=1 Tax=Blastopirellula sp. J2-11 TaxID=2943192 RepID=UPI0021C85700|nr:superoxide dismutase family protein [Blastopirellula sp. J2-11]UUO09163.1 superoxide dismutase family protein [Blastopirellula sp. J2-11]
MKSTLMLAVTTEIALALAAMFGAEHAEHAAEMTAPKAAVAVLIPTEGNSVQGVIRLKMVGESLEITGQVSGLKPGEHGFHIHEFGDLTAADGTAAGGHYNPSGHEHGGPDAADHHAGDLGNITADDKGIATVNKVAKDLKLPMIMGRSFVVHAGVDDLKSQPSGDAGPRVAVGVIGYTKEAAPAK